MKLKPFLTRTVIALLLVAAVVLAGTLIYQPQATIGKTPGFALQKPPFLIYARPISYFSALNTTEKNSGRASTVSLIEPFPASTFPTGFQAYSASAPTRRLIR